MYKIMIKENHKIHKLEFRSKHDKTMVVSFLRDMGFEVIEITL